MLKPEHFRTIAALHYATAEETVLTEHIKSASQKDAEALQGLEDLKRNGLRKMLDGSFDWEEKEGLVYHRGKIYIPDDFELRRDVIKSCHDTREAGHPGRLGTQELVARLYWWPRMAQNVADYVAGCDQCQRNKAAVHPPVRLTPLDVPEGPWQVIGQDLIVGLPKVKGYDTILVFADLYGKGVHLIPTTEKVNAEGVADIHYREIYRLHGIPERFVSDRGPQFNAELCVRC